MSDAKVKRKPGELSDPEIAAAILYVQRCLALLQCETWKITISEEWADDDFNAEVACTPKRYHATVYLPRWWADSTNDIDNKRNTLMHEAIHIAMGQVDFVIDDQLKDQSAMSKDVFDCISGHYSHQAELFVDRMQTAFERAGAQPAWPSKTAIAKTVANLRMSRQ